jgi:ubiquinone/menaquinone biosynthesis C-methylase UbiE
MTDDNKQYYETGHSVASLELRPARRYDRKMIEVRFGYLERFAPGRRVVDLCCGSGSYLFPFVPRCAHAYGIDYSRQMLDGFRVRYPEGLPANLDLLLEDARALSLPAASVDFVCSFASLYTVPDVDRVVAEVGRILAPGGHAVLEFGNRRSLNALVMDANYRDAGLAQPFNLSIAAIRDMVEASRLEIVEWRSFQLLPMYGAPARLRWLLPLLHPWFKGPLSADVGGRMLDERLSSSWPLRHLAFRQVVVARKR